MRGEVGGEENQAPYPVYDPAIEAFWEAFLGSGGPVDPYGRLPEDPIDATPPTVWEPAFTAGSFSEATVDQIRRYLMLCRRRERFCDGHIAAEFENGTLLAAMNRLRSLREAMPDKAT